MVIIGPKIVLPDKESSRGKCFNGLTQNFTKAWKICFDQQKLSTSSANNIDEDHELKHENERNHLGKKKKKIGRLWKMFNLAPKILLYEGQKGLEKQRYFSLIMLRVATQNFSFNNKIGGGSFGPVYKGVLPDRTTIAVKILSQSTSDGISQFTNEVNILSNLIHPNIIKLYGSHSDSGKYLLVYQYMQNGNLDDALQPDEDVKKLKRKLDWKTRFKICLGIAKGIAYLHELNIVHRDIKLANILLDKSLKPKISDFGLAMHCQGELTNQPIEGTYGYTPPEYTKHGILSAKADVYSFGVLTLALMSRKNVYSYYGEYELLQELAVSLLKKGDLLELIDEDMKTNISVEEAKMVLDLAMLCIVDDPTMRPSMSEVVSILEGKTSIKTLPSPLGSYYSSIVDHDTEEEDQINCGCSENL